MNGSLIPRLPQVRGSYTESAPLKDLVWFRAAGPADVLFRPADLDDLRNFVANKPADVPVTIIGVGSNLLIRDGGIAGVVIRLPAAFGAIERDAADGPHDAVATRFACRKDGHNRDAHG